MLAQGWSQVQLNGFVRVVSVAALSLVAALVGCGGGGGGGSTTPPPPPPATPTPTPTGASTSFNATPTAWQNLASYGGFSGRVLVQGQNVPSGTTVTALTNIVAPAGAPPLPPFHGTSVIPAPLAYVTLTSSVSFVAGAQPNFDILVPSSAGVATGYLLQYATLNTSQPLPSWQFARLRGLVAGVNDFQFNGDPVLLELIANQPVICAFVAIPLVTASPPGFQFVGLNKSGTFTVSEPQYAGQFTATSDTPSVATVSANADGSFTVTGVAVGSATITVSDSRGLTTGVSVTVTTIAVGVG